MPSPRVCRAQGDSWPVSDIIEEFFERYQSLPEPKPDAATKTGSVWTAQDPCVGPAQRISPKRSLSPVQCDTFDSNDQPCVFVVPDRMNRFHGISQFTFIDLQLRPSALETRLRF